MSRYVPHRRRALVLVLDDLLARSGRTHSEIAIRTGVDQAVISRLRRGVADCSRETLECLTDALCLTAYDRARVLCAAGFLPIADDPVFIETVCQIAARRGLTRDAEAATMELQRDCGGCTSVPL
jgi:hypothetical protein